MAGIERMNAMNDQSMVMDLNEIFIEKEEEEEIFYLRM